MSDHLPECGANDGSMFCICPSLRACEQRVAQESYEQIYDKGYDNGYANGVQAARDAVAAASLRIPYEDRRHVYLDDALAAIDALRGEPNE